MTELVLPTALPERSDFKGWKRAKLLDWLDEAVPACSRITAAMRLRIGLALWHLRESSTDAEYSADVSRLISEYGVTIRSLQAWRRDAEEKFDLPSPDARTEAQRWFGENRRRQAETASSQQASEVSSLANSGKQQSVPTPAPSPAPTPTRPYSPPPPYREPNGHDERNPVARTALALTADDWMRSCTEHELRSLIATLSAALA